MESMETIIDEVPVQLYDSEQRTLYNVYLNPNEVTRCENDIVSEKNQEENIWNIKGNNQSDSQNEESDEKSLWSHNDTLALITSYENHRDNFKIVKKRKTVWENISNELVSLGILKSASRCETKWKNLLRTYKNVKDMKNSSGRGASRFLFFDRIDEILGDRPSMSCTHTFSSTIVDSMSSETSKNHSEDGSMSGNILVDKSNNNDNGPNLNIPNDKAIETKINSGKKVRNTLKRKTEELIDLKMKYLKNKQEDRDAKEKRKEEKILLQKRLVALEEKKVALLEQYVKNNDH